MRLAITLCAILSVAFAGLSHLDLDAWQDFKLSHNKVYDPQEERQRFQIFSENLKEINEHNALHRAGLRTYKKAVNKFADLTEEEFKNYLTLSGPKPKLEGSLGVHETPANVQVPESIDYRSKNAVNPIKDQKSCGSCWAFSTVGSLESINYLQNKVLLSLSEQNLVDCSGSYGNNGCNGGLMELAFNYIRDNGLELEDAYPYKAHDQKCKFNKSESAVSVKGYKNVAEGDEDNLKSAVGTVGPTSVAVDASEFRFYHSGIFKSSYDNYQLNHGVVAVGYGSEDSHDYWIVRNSWGASWGENGYIRIARNDGNQVGIAEDASYPVL